MLNWDYWLYSPSDFLVLILLARGESVKPILCCELTACSTGRSVQARLREYRPAVLQSSMNVSKSLESAVTSMIETFCSLVRVGEFVRYVVICLFRALDKELAWGLLLWAAGLGGGVHPANSESGLHTKLSMDSAEGN